MTHKKKKAPEGSGEAEKRKPARLGGPDGTR